MKLATLKSDKSLDGELVVISTDLKKYVKAADVSSSLREAIEKLNYKKFQMS